MKFTPLWFAFVPLRMKFAPLRYFGGVWDEIYHTLDEIIQNTRQRGNGQEGNSEYRKGTEATRQQGTQEYKFDNSAIWQLIQ